MKLHFRQLCLMVLFCLLSICTYAQKGQTITGVVVDETNKPLLGVTVLEKGTTNGVVTDTDGRYRITLKQDNSTLVYSFVGYAAQEIAITKRKEINLQLVPEATELNEVVVVGYGQQKKASVIGAITTVEAKTVANTSKSRLSQSLAGNLAGVIAVQRSGELGNDHADFWIRGISTFAGASSPLIIVDGVERDFNSIDPQEIESFSVMKDASATAVYGVRGANGVLVITTKKGTVGAPKVNVNAEFSLKQPTQMPKFVDAVDFMKIANEASVRTGHGEAFAWSRINNTIDRVDDDLYPNVDWINSLTKPFTMHERVNVNVSGGAPKVRYFVSASFHNESGLYETDTDRDWNANINLKKINFRSNLDADITPTTNLNLNIGSQLSIHNGPNESTDYLWELMMDMPPYFIPMRYSDGRLSAYGAGSEKGNNPYNRLTQTGYKRTTSNALNSTAAISQNLNMITDGLSAKVMFAYDVWTGHYYKGAFNPQLWYATDRDENGQLNAIQVDPGEEFLKKSIWSDMSYTTYLEGNINYNKNFGEHSVGAMLLYNQKVYNTNSGDGEYNVIPYKNQGMAGRFTYNYSNKYFAEFNFGYNGSENFAAKKRFGFFPAVAAGWYISEEKFWQNIRPVISKFKLRGSIGQVGNDQLGGPRFAYITEIIDDGYYDYGLPGSGNGMGGITEGKFGSKSLTWETETKRDIGVEIGLFNSLELDIDYFYNNRRDIFMQRKTIPGSAGFNEAPWVNYGKMKNQGVDATIKFNKRLKDWSIGVIGNFTYARNKITEWDEPDRSSSNLYRTGSRFDQQFGLIADGLYSDADFDANGKLLQNLPRPDFGLDVKPGDIKYVDVNGDGMINMYDETPIGYSTMPEIVYGFGVNATYKSFDFGVRFQGAANATRMINDPKFLPFAKSLQKGNLYSDAIFDRWTEANPSQDVFFPRMRDYKDGHNYVNSTWWQKDMSFLRVKDIVLGYTLPQTISKRAGIESLRVYFIANNLFNFSSFDLWDVELGTNHGMKYPIMKSYNFGLEFNF